MRLCTLLISVTLILLSSISPSHAQDFISVTDALWSSDGSQFVLNTTSGVQIYALDDLEAAPTLVDSAEDSYLNAMATDAQEPILYLSIAPEVEYRREIRAYDLGTGRLMDAMPIRELDGSPSIYDMQVDDRGMMAIATVTYADVFQIDSGSTHYQDLRGLYSAIALHPTRLEVAVGRLDGVLFAYNMRAAPSVIPPRTEFEFAIQSLNYSHDGAYLAVQFASQGATLLDSTTLEPLPLPETVAANSNAIIFSPESETLVVGKTGTIDFYPFSQGEVDIETSWQLPHDDARAFRLVYSPDGTQLLSVDTTGDVLIWDVSTGEIVVEVGNFDSGFDRRWG